ncbi:MAG: NUDIX domain-containing protein [Acidaminococcaceae bacterium]
MNLLEKGKLWEKHLSTETVFDGKFLKIAVDKVILPNGREAVRELVHHPGAVAILPILEDGSIVFVKQYRYPLDSVLYEIPAGKLEINEEPLKCAIRELSEETGYSAAKWSKLTTIATTPGFTDEIIHLYLAEGLELHEQHTDDDEFIEVVTIEKEDVRKMLLAEAIFDAKTLSALYLYFLRKE